MRQAEFDSMSNKSKIKAKAFHARATSGVLTILLDAFPVKIDTYFEGVYGENIDLQTYSQFGKPAVFAAIALLENQGIITLKNTKPSNGCFDELTLTPSGYLFAKALSQNGKKDSLLKKMMDEVDDMAMLAYDVFIEKIVSELPSVGKFK